MSIGRNDPCPCGSGLKYKRCCLLQLTPNAGEFKKRRWALVQKELIKKLQRHISEVYGPDAIEAAWDEFHLFDNEEGFNPSSQELPLFFPWFFYEWYPFEEELGEGIPEIPPAISLLESRTSLSPDEKAYLIGATKSSFSFFEVKEVEKGKSLLLTDLLCGAEHFVLEKSGSEVARPHDILFGKVFHIDGFEILEASSSIVIPPKMKPQILDLRKVLRRKRKEIDDLLLHEYYLEILELYQFIYDELMNPPEPIITNTDGHLLIPHKLVFDIADPMATFEDLHQLCFKSTREELLQSATFDDQGKLAKLEFSWLKKGNKKNKAWDNTILGNISIEGLKMTVEVNSKERARKFKTELKKLMTSEYSLRATEIQSLESMKKADPGPANEKDLMKNPEVIQKMEEMMKAHWEGWIHEKLPALGGISPTDAMKTKKGREQLEILLNQLERIVEVRPMIGQTIDTIRGVRARLGL